jgi:hypothetical protein
MPAHEFIVRYNELPGLPGMWEEALISFGKWRHEGRVPGERVDNQAGRTPRSFSIQFVLRHDIAATFDQLKVLAKEQARAALHRYHPGARVLVR